MCVQDNCFLYTHCNEACHIAFLDSHSPCELFCLLMNVADPKPCIHAHGQVSMHKESSNAHKHQHSGLQGSRHETCMTYEVRGFAKCVLQTEQNIAKVYKCVSHAYMYGGLAYMHAPSLFVLHMPQALHAIKHSGMQGRGTCHMREGCSPSVSHDGVCD